MAVAPGSESPTARARVRSAGLGLFAECGIGGASVRDVAAVADVSGGLVRHRFGSTKALRAACDGYEPGSPALRDQLSRALGGDARDPDGPRILRAKERR